MTPEQLLRYARPDEILRDDERKRRNDFLQLFSEQLDRVAADPESPLITEVVVARRAAELLWTMDRTTSDTNRALARRQLVQERGSHHARSEVWGELELKARLTAIVQQEIRAMDDLLELSRAATEEEPALKLVPAQ